MPSGNTPRAGPSTGTPRPGTTSAAASPAATSAAAMLLEGHFGFSSVAGVGSGFTPRGIGLTPTAMQITASQGGFSAIAAAHDQEEDRKRRIESIVELMSTRWGYVSQEGVERCARRLGLECLWEESMGEERKRILTIAGHGVLVDVEFRGEEVRGVTLQFEGSKENVMTGAGAASEVLKQNLRETEDAGYVLLDRFVGNLERLASMDRLGGAELNCFDAVQGIHVSLGKIYALEVGKSKLKDKKEVSWEVMCQQSGRPRRHTRGRVGLAVQFWVERRFVSEDKTAEEAMDIDNTEDTTTEDEIPIWSLIVECEALPAELYPPLRNSEAWVSEAVEKPAETNTSSILPDMTPIDWQEPSPTLLSPKSPTDGTGSIDIDSASIPKPPDVHFIAKFDPPVIVPLQIAIQIHESVGSPLSQESLLPTTFENLIFADMDPQDTPPATPRSVENTIASYDSTTHISKPHKQKSTLFTQPNDYARAITHLPFSHPRQLITLLPTLRQWVITASILRRSFTSDSPDPVSSLLTTTNGTAHPPSPTPPSPTFQTLEAELAAFMSTPLPSSTSSSTAGNPSTSTTPIEITLATAPLPRFNINFPNPRYQGRLVTVAFNISLNGIIDVVDVDDGRNLWHQQQQQQQETGNANVNGSSTLPRDEDVEKVKIRTREKVKRVLEVGESIGICVDWMTR